MAQPTISAAHIRSHLAAQMSGRLVPLTGVHCSHAGVVEVSPKRAHNEPEREDCGKRNEVEGTLKTQQMSHTCTSYTSSLD
jgi:hypothetical protein